MNRTYGVFFTLLGALLAGHGHESSAAQAATTLLSDVRDSASVFSADEVEATRGRLRALESEFKVATVIESIESLKGKSVDDVAVALARQSGTSGLFILISKRESKLEVLPSHRVEAAFPRSRRNAIRGAFVEKFRKKDFDGGLKQGVQTIEVALREAARDNKLPGKPESPPRPADPKDDSVVPLTPKKPEVTAEAAREFGIPRNVGTGPQLVIREQVRLTLAGAQAIIEAGQRQAESMNLKVNIYVVDDGGHPIAFARMDGGRPASVYTALTKAVTAATYRQPTGPLPVGAAQPDVHLNIALQNAASAGGGRMTTLFGGLPVVVDGQVIGGVGVGGGSGEQDRTVAKAGIDEFLKRLDASKAAPKTSSSDEKPKQPASSVERPTAPGSKQTEEKDF